MEWCCCNSEAGAVEYCGEHHPRLPTGSTEWTAVHSHSVSVAPAKTSRSLDTSFTDPTLLRGCCLPLLLRGCGRHLLSPQVAEEEKAKLLRDSRIVPKLDVFITHSWRDSGLAKYLCMLLYCNGYQAAALSVGAGVVACVLVIMGALPLWPITYSPWPSLVGVPLFWLGLLFLHLAPRWPGGGRGPSYFLDKLCIDQCDPARKRAGIESLAAFIAASDRLLMMWSPTYFTRLWCTVEVATFLHMRSQTPSGLSLRRTLVFRPLQLPTLTVFAIVAIELGMLAIQPRYFLKLSRLGHVVAYLIAFSVPFGMILGVVHRARVLAHDREDLESRLAEFRIEEADCSLDSDRDIVYSTVEDFFGSLDGFNQLMRGRFREEVLAGLPGRNGAPVDFLVFMLLPFVLPALDWIAYNVIVYRRDGDWKALASHTVHNASGMLNAWFVADIIFRLMNTRRARGLWRPGAARNMMVSVAINVPVTVLCSAQFATSGLLRYYHPALITTHCLLTGSALLITRRLPSR